MHENNAQSSKKKILCLIDLKESDIPNTKVHFAIGEKVKKEPLYAFYRDDFKEWQENQSKENFRRDYILSLIYYGKDEWLFAGIYRSISVEKLGKKIFKYNTELTPLGSEYIGKLIIKFNKSKKRNAYLYLEENIDNMELLEILRKKYTVEPFPGFENVNISHSTLKTIISKEESSWKSALSNVKGVYLISDMSNGKLYVGSAYGDNAFWNRWKEYAQNGHGGNKELKAIIKKNGIEYAKNFQYSILETTQMNTGNEVIISRESYWKDILLSRDFGYNSN